MTIAAIALPTEKMIEFCDRWQMTELALLGSVLRNNFRPDSDIEAILMS